MQIQGIIAGTHADRPAASSNVGCFYWETNSNTLYQSDGANWNLAGPPLAQVYTPVLQGATDNPVPTYTTQIGRYFVLGKLCYVDIVVVTSTASGWYETV